MREIKFRAWDKEYGNMYQNAYPFEHLVYVEMFDDDETFERFKHKMMMVNGKYFYFIVSKDIALMQFTGLLDRNGKEVYEGDIVRDARWDGLFEVKWCTGQKEFLGSQVGWILDDERFCAVPHTVELVAYAHVDSHRDREDYFHGEVIGNIHESPELLQKPQ